MKGKRTVRSLEQIRVMANPMRMRLLEAFSHEPATTKQVAEQVGESPTKLYHHVHALKRAGLIELVKTRKKRGTTEKYYRTVADEFIVDRKLFEIKPYEKVALNRVRRMTVKVFDNAMAEMQQSLSESISRPKRERGQFILSNAHIYATPEQVVKLSKEINTLIKKYDKEKGKKGCEEFGTTFALYRIARKKNTEKRRKR
jgi:predicted transcriptional regulator